MTTTSTGLPADFFREVGLDLSDFSYMAANPLEFMPSGAGFPVKIGEPITFKTQIGSQEFEAGGVFTGTPQLNSLTLQMQEAMGDRGAYHVVSATVNQFETPKLWLRIEDKQVPITEFLRAMINASIPAEREYDEARFLERAAAIGFHFSEHARWSLITHHMGADVTKAEALIEVMKAHGATDEMPTLGDRAGRIQQRWSLSPGFPVVQFEMRRADRSASARNQGFLDPINAIVENFQRVVAAKRELATRSKAAEAAEAQFNETKKWQKGWDEAKLADEKLAIVQLRRMSGSWTNHIGGAVQRLAADPNNPGAFIPMLTADPVQVPCGRLLLVVDDAETEFEFWSNSQAPGTAPQVPIIPASNITSTGDTGRDEEPF